jgi:hypothetical protein
MGTITAHRRVRHLAAPILAATAALTWMSNGPASAAPDTLPSRPTATQAAAGQLPGDSERARAASRASRSTSGYQPSLYKGAWYKAKAESFRRCVMSRESHYNYRAKNRSSSAMGAYQLLDSKWRSPLVSMMRQESKKTKDGLITEINALQRKPIQGWSRYWQDRAFWTAYQNGDGWRHWYHPGSLCNSLAT